MQVLLYYDPMGGENMPALSALLNYIGMYHQQMTIYLGSNMLITCNTMVLILLDQGGSTCLRKGGRLT